MKKINVLIIADDKEYQILVSDAIIEFQKKHPEFEFANVTTTIGFYEANKIISRHQTGEYPINMIFLMPEDFRGHEFNYVTREFPYLQYFITRVSKEILVQIDVERKIAPSIYSTMDHSQYQSADWKDILSSLEKWADQ